MKAILCLFVFLAIAASASARLGETYEQCVDRYGVPIEPLKGESAKFQKADIVLEIRYLKGVAAVIQFHHLYERTPFGAEEIDTLLKANSGGGEWKESPGKIDQTGKTKTIEKRWETSAGDVAAYTTFVCPAFKAYSFSIKSAAFAKWQKLPVEKTLDGF